MLAVAVALCAYVLPVPLGHASSARRLGAAGGDVVMAVRLNNYMLEGPLQAAGAVVLVKLNERKEDKSSGGLVLSASQRKARDGVVISCGPGVKHPESAAMLPTGIAVGDHVVMDELELEGEKIKYLGSPHRILPASRVLGKLEGGVMSMPTFRPLGDRLLVKLPEPAEQTVSGIVLAGLEDGDRPNQGVVMSVGPGPLNAKAEPNPMPVAPGDFVVFRKYAGDEIDFEDGAKYRIVSGAECLAKYTE
jgi:chaperonin GroES